MNRVLMIAYHFPPVHVSSGVHRTLYFVRHLQEHKWHPLVLTINPRAYIRSEESLLAQIPPDVPVTRSFALDAKRHLSIKGHYLSLMAVPDRWQSWWLFGVISGLRLIRRYHPRALWSTFPIATAILIGFTLHRLTQLPWIVDFRDPMSPNGAPLNSEFGPGYRALERRAVENSSAVILTTPGTAETYLHRYPNERAGKWHIIENGYDEELFAQAEMQLDCRCRSEPPTLVHSGLLYPSGRSPIPFFDALEKLSLEKKITSKDIHVVLRASGSADLYRAEIHRRNLESIVTLAPPLKYKEALAEMLSAAGLLLFQGSSFNNQIPAKAYEYIRARRPILALTDPQGETAELLRRAECSAIVAPIDDADAIAAAIPKLFMMPHSRNGNESHRWSRSAGCARLGHILNEATGGFKQ